MTDNQFHIPTNNSIRLTNNWLSDFQGDIGKVVLNDTARASFLYEMLKMRPDSFKLEIGYTVDKHGKYHLNEISLVNKHSRYHPLIIKRRLADVIRRSLRRTRTTEEQWDNSEENEEMV